MIVPLESLADFFAMLSTDRLPAGCLRREEHFGKAWRRVEGGEARFDASLADKAMAVLSLAAWLAVLYAGRMLPFLGKSF
jgi:hypothetical protein